jgi:DNA-binding IscR family transcriptional regulator
MRTKSEKFLDTILGELRNAFYFVFQWAKAAATHWLRPAHEIKVGHMFACLTDRWPPFPARAKFFAALVRIAPTKNIDKRLIMLEARNAIATVLDNRTLAEMRALGRQRRKTLMYCI